MANNLSYEVIRAIPRPFNFSKGFGEKWDIPLPLTDDEWQDETYAPIYDFLYPLGDRFSVPRDFRDRLANTTIVQVDDAYHLALTGCGMDFSWEICASYLNLGYYPPGHFCDLPAMSGRGESRGDRRIVRGCLASLDALVLQNSGAADRLRDRYLARRH